MCSMEPQLSSLGDQESQKEVFVWGNIKNSLQAGKQVQASSEPVQKSAPPPLHWPHPLIMAKLPSRCYHMEPGP